MEVGLLGFWFIQSLVVEISSSSNAEKSGAVMVLLLTAGVFTDLIALEILSRVELSSISAGVRPTELLALCSLFNCGYNIFLVRRIFSSDTGIDRR